MMTEQQPDAPAIPGVIRYRVREPVTITAIEWTGENEEDVRAFAGSVDVAGLTPCYVARSGGGHFFTVDADRFAATYEATVFSPLPGAQDHAGGNWRELIAAALTAVTGIAEAEAAADVVMAVIRPLAELEAALESGTSCTRCAATLDLAAAQTFAREAAKAKLTEIAGACRDTIRYPECPEGEMLLALAILAITGGGEETDRG